MKHSGGSPPHAEGAAAPTITSADAVTRTLTRHAQAVLRSLRFADDAAARGDYRDALGWVDTVEHIGDTLPAEYEAKRRTWLRAAAQVRANDRH